MCVSFLPIPSAGMGFFFSTWLTMIFWGIISPDLGIETIGYTRAMLITIGIWIVIAPLAAAVAKGRIKRFRGPF